MLVLAGEHIFSFIAEDSLECSSKDLLETDLLH